MINKAEAFFHSKFAKDYYLSFPECVQKIVSALRKLVLQKRDVHLILTHQTTKELMEKISACKFVGPVHNLRWKKIGLI